MEWTDEDRKRVITARINIANEKTLKSLEHQASRVDDPLRTWMLDKIKEKKKKNDRKDRSSCP